MADTVFAEILSADPIGLLSLAQGRTAVQGDILASLYAFCGQTVKREYYVNDMGRRAAALCDSVRQCILEAEGEVGEGRYDRTVRTVAHRLRAGGIVPSTGGSEEEWRDVCGAQVPEILLDLQRGTLERLGVRFDSWFEEVSLPPQAVETALRRLQEAGLAEEIDGALWLDGSSDDRALLRRDNGAFTYFAVDIAYHLSKAERGATRMIDVWGPAYHRHRNRLGRALAALGAPRLDIIVTGPIRFEHDGLPVHYLDADALLLDPLLDHGSAAALRYHLNAAPPEAELVLTTDALSARELPRPLEATLELVAALRALDPGEPGEPPRWDLLEESTRWPEDHSSSEGRLLAAVAQSTGSRITLARRGSRPDGINSYLEALASAYEGSGGAPGLERIDPSVRRGVRIAAESLLHLLGLQVTSPSDPSPTRGGKL